MGFLNIQLTQTVLNNINIFLLWKWLRFNETQEILAEFSAEANEIDIVGEATKETSGALEVKNID